MFHILIQVINRREQCSCIPNFNDRDWWFKNYCDYQRNSNSEVSKLFVFAVCFNDKDNIFSGDKKVANFYLIDLFAAATSDNINNSIKNTPQKIGINNSFLTMIAKDAMMPPNAKLPVSPIKT